MKLSEIKSILPTLETVAFQLEDGSMVPENFHVTEIGMVTKDFIDCGGVTRHEKVVNFQLWNANDTEHRLKPSKLLYIIQLAQDKLNINDLDIEVEYQAKTIGKYGLSMKNDTFLLTNKQTNCLAQDKCGIPESMISLEQAKSACTPGGGCC